MRKSVREVNMVKPISRALISVSDKTDLIPFATFLSRQGVEILSTGGTRQHLRQHHIPVTGIDEYSGFSEIMGGRVKTLHPKIHGGILSRRDEDQEEMAACGISEIDLVAVNLYPFETTVSKPGCTRQEAIENIDIGGPAMLRSAAKNYQHVTVVSDSSDYERVMQEMRNNEGQTSSALRQELAAKAFEHTTRYDRHIADYLSDALPPPEADFPAILKTGFVLRQKLRYGENPHQKAGFYVDPKSRMPGVSTARKLQGKELSYNNIADADAAIGCVLQFDEAPACVIVKHANPCGAAVAESVQIAYDRAYQTDPESAFGGIVAFNCELDASIATTIIDRQFVEVIIAPKIAVEAIEIFGSKPSIRILELGSLDVSQPVQDHDLKKVSGGLLVQTPDDRLCEKFECATKRPPSDQESRDLIFAWKIAKFVKSNAIVYAANQKTLGIGAGQMSRVNSARIAGIRADQAGFDLRGAVMSSDAFFPFRDAIDNAAECGIKAIIQPGGSVRDKEVIAAANEHDMTMVYTGMRHFRH